MTTRLISYVVNATIAILIFSVIGALELNHFSRNHSAGMVIAIVCVVVGFFMLGTFLSITRTTILRQIREVAIVQQQRESELKLLRSQLSPHFLFNVLNNLYGLSIRQDQKVPRLILKLSDLLRYSIYDTNRDFVPLTSELAYIDNYIELESTRIGDNLRLESNIQKRDIEGIIIAPMILIVFVENAFKHSKHTLVRDIQIKIDSHICGDNLVFEIKNNYSDIPGKQNIKEGSGMGLAVTMKRLELLYPGNYSLETVRENGYYIVKLQLKIK
jgi:LytS/YehU family sensor histidine kinase